MRFRHFIFVTLFTLIGFTSFCSSVFADGIIVRTADRVVLDSISTHKMNYVFPFTYSNDQNSAKQSELIFQFSAKKMVFMPNLYVAYTQQLYWLFLDDENSSPMRELNYNPEIFYDFTPDFFESKGVAFKGLGAYLGFEHESNGQRVERSRSWDRFYFWPYWDTNSSQYSLKLWFRRPEDDKDEPLDPKGDDNPDIHRFMGYSEFYFFHSRKNEQLLSGMLRGNLATGKAAVQVDYSWPLSAKNTHFVARVFSGYGETLIDYNNSIDRVSFGFKVLNL